MKQSFPKFEQRRVVCLDGVWEFAFPGDVDPESLTFGQVTFDRIATVPGCHDTLPGLAGRRGLAAYRTRVRAQAGQGALLELQGLGLWARVWIDGQHLADIELPYSGVMLPVPPSEQSEREVVLWIDNRFDRGRVPLFDPFFDFYGYGGIYRSVYWHAVGTVAIDRADIRTVSLAPPRIAVEVRFHGPAPAMEALDLRLDGGAWQRAACTVTPRGTLALALDVPDAKPWSPECPELHTLQVRCGEDDIIERFGLRLVATDGPRILLNGTPVGKLLGYCRHEAHPQCGPALPYSLLLQDALQLREMGCNFVRGSHYPQDPRFLDLCDELGLLVFEESLGWGQRVEPHFVDPRFCDRQEEQTRRMVRNSFNHPAVILWGFLNEGQSNHERARPLYARLVQAVRAEDETRLVTYATMHPLDDVTLDLPDVISVNCYPGWYAPPDGQPRPLHEIAARFDALFARFDRDGVGGKPVIISEIGAGAIYGWRDPHAAHWSEQYQAELLDEVCRLVIDNDRIAGLSIWQFCDGRTYDHARALGRPRAFNNKGTFDEYRRPKMAYDVVKRHFRAAT